MTHPVIRHEYFPAICCVRERITSTVTKLLVRRLAVGRLRRLGPKCLLVVLCAFTLMSTFGLARAEQAVGKEASRYEFDPELPWLNVARPLTLDELRGKIVILDFWTYGCINCIHVLDDLARLEREHDEILAVIGVHSPKFDNEKNVDTLREVVVRYDIHHPVVSDVDMEVGKHFGMQAWPTQVVIDPEGDVLGKVVGEGNYEVLNRAVEQLARKHEKILNRKPLPLSLEKDRGRRGLLAAPGKIAASDRFVAISDSANHRVLLSDHGGRIVEVFGDGSPGLEDGPASTAQFRSPQGLAFAEDVLYVADTANHVVRAIDLTTKRVSTVAGGGDLELRRSGQADATRVQLRSPWALAIHEPWLYIAMAGRHQIWRLDLERARVGVYAGSGREGIADGDLTDAEFSQPSGLSIQGEWLYVADAEDSAVRRIHLVEERVETLVGTGLFDFGDRDGPFWNALLQHVLGVAVVDESTVLIADTYNHKLRRLDLSTREVVTLAGTGRPGTTLGEGESAELNEPGGLIVVDDKVLIADTNNHRIVQYDLRTGRLDHWKLRR